MSRDRVATGSRAERARLHAADHDGVPWRRWRPSVEDGALIRMTDDMDGLALAISVAPLTAASRTSDSRFTAATPTASFVETTARSDGTRAVTRIAKRSAEDLFIDVTVMADSSETTELVVRLALDVSQVSSDDPCAPSVRVPWESHAPGIDGDVHLLCAQQPGRGTWWLSLAAPDTGVTAVEEGRSAALHVEMPRDPGSQRTIMLRLGRGEAARSPVGVDAAATMGTRSREAAAFDSSMLTAATQAPTQAPTKHCSGTLRAALASSLWAPDATDQTVVGRVMDAVAVGLADPMAAQARLLAVIEDRPATNGPDASIDPPVTAWAALRIGELATATDRPHDEFLERAFQSLLEDYSDRVDRLDAPGRNPLQGGLLALDGRTSSAEGSAWMGCHSVWMLSIAIQLARTDPAYQDVAVTLLESTLAMVAALDDLGGSGIGMWDEDDGWYHEVTRDDAGAVRRLPGPSVIGLVPLLAVAVLPRDALTRAQEVAVRLGWSMRHELDPAGAVVRAPRRDGTPGDVLVSLVPAERRARALGALGGSTLHVTPLVACLMLDVFDRLRAFECRAEPGSSALRGADPATREAAALPDITDRLVHGLAADPNTPGWATVLAGARRRSR